MDTKERILDAALTLFAEKGYEGVSVGEIAQAVGIKAPSLYKHYSSKQAIFDAIVRTMNERYEDQARAMDLNGADPMVDAEHYGAVSLESLEQMVLHLFSFFLHDPWTARFRRMLTLEQFKSPELGKLYSSLYGDRPISYQGKLFSCLMAAGLFPREDPEALALAFYGPIYLLLTLCDRDPDREGEALQMLTAHVRQFQKYYGKK